MKQFFSKNKVLLTGLVSAVLMALYSFTVAPTTDWVIVGYSAFIAAGSFLANNLRGQWPTIIGVLLTSAATIYESYSTGVPLNAVHLIYTCAINIGLALVGPPKSIGYERTGTIEQAKAEGDRITAKK